MEPISLTKDEIERALVEESGDRSCDTFHRFLAVQIVRTENSGNIPTKKEDSWGTWYSDFINQSVGAYVLLVPFPDKISTQWWKDSIPDVAGASSGLVSSLAEIIAKKRAARAAVTEENSDDADPPGYNSIKAQKPRPSIRFATRRLYPDSYKPSDTIYLYYSSPPSLSLLLQDLRKRHEVGPGKKFTILRAETPHARIRVLVGEEQEDWDWEAVVENISRHNHEAAVVFVLQPE